MNRLEKSNPNELGQMIMGDYEIQETEGGPLVKTLQLVNMTIPAFTNLRAFASKID